MRHLLFCTLTAIGAWAALATGVRADDQKTTDVKFVKEVNQINLTEVQAGKLAQQRSSNANVKKYGERLAMDHHKAGEELAMLARRKGLTLTKELDSMEKDLIAKLSKLSGAEFDRMFTR